jgi:hypothetical protein
MLLGSARPLKDLLALLKARELVIHPHSQRLQAQYLSESVPGMKKTSERTLEIARGIGDSLA